MQCDGLQGDRLVERDHHALLRVPDDPIGLLFAHLAHQQRPLQSRTAFGIETWNLADNVATKFMGLPFEDR
jgi:hypothetical protein